MSAKTYHALSRVASCLSWFPLSLGCFLGYRGLDYIRCPASLHCWTYRRNNHTGECTRDLFFGPWGSYPTAQYRELVPASFAPILVDKNEEKASATVDKGKGKGSKKDDEEQQGPSPATWFVSLLHTAFTTSGAIFNEIRVSLDRSWSRFFV